MSKHILVFGDKTFKLTLPDDVKITFGPWSPPTKERTDYGREEKRGTLRIYQGTEKNILAVFAGVSGFRDLSIGYAEEIAKEEGATIWKDDEEGYVREDKVSRKRQWVEPEIPELPAKTNGHKKATVA